MDFEDPQAKFAHLHNLKKTDIETWNSSRQKDPSLRTDLREADLTGMQLRGANLSRADLVWADFSDANLRGATLEGTIFGNTKLTGALGLETCRYAGRASSTFEHSKNPVLFP